MSVEPDEADATYFDRLGQGLMHRIWRENPSTVDTRRFRSFFGTSPDVCSTLWRRLYPTMSQPGFATKHLLWALNFMKCYQTEAVASSAVAQCDEKTLRKWVWIFVESIGNLQRQVASRCDMECLLLCA